MVNRTIRTYLGTFALQILLLPLYCPSFALAQDANQEKAHDLTNQALQIKDSNPQRSAEMLWQAAALDPTSAVIQYDLGFAFRRLKRYRESWQAYQKAVTLDPSDPDFWIQLCYAYKNCGDLAHAQSISNDTARRFAGNAAAQKDIAELNEHLALGRGTASKETVTPEALAVYKARHLRAPQDLGDKANYAWALTKAGQAAAAAEIYKSLVATVPTERDYLRSLMWSQTRAGDLEGLQVSRRLYVARFPTADDVQSIKDEIAYYGRDFKNIRAREASTGGDIDQRAYPPSRMPIKVCVPDIWRSKLVWSANAAPSKSGPAYAKIVEDAFNSWAKATDNQVKFQFVSVAEDSDLTCEWTTDKSKLVHSFAAGVTTRGRNRFGDPTSIIFILIEPDVKKFDKADFYTTALHEIGHSLGLGHSSNPADVMYFAGRAPELSEGDKARIRRIYPR